MMAMEHICGDHLTSTLRSALKLKEDAVSKCIQCQE